jgi:hypothetical protein
MSELPSAQPVSLGDFTIRSQTNNKGSKSWKPFPQEDRTNEQASETGEAFRRPHRPVDRYFPPNASPSPAYHQSQLRSPPLSYYGHGAAPYQLPDYQYPMYQGMNYYQQMYPGQLGYYPMIPAMPTNYPMMRSPSPGKSPNRRRQNRSRNRFALHDMSPTKQQEMMRLKLAGHEVDKKQGNEQQIKEYNLPYSGSDTVLKRIALECKGLSHPESEEASHDMFPDTQQFQHQDPPSTPEQVICRPEQEISVKDQPQTSRHDQAPDSPQMDFLGSDNAEEKFYSPSQPLRQSPSSHPEFSPQSILHTNSPKVAAPPPKFSLADANVSYKRTSEEHHPLSKAGDGNSSMAIARLGHIGPPNIGDGSRETRKFSLDDAEIHDESVELNSFLNGVPKTSSRLERDIFDLEDPFAPEQNDGVASQPRSPSHHRDRSSVKPYVPLVNKYEKDIFASEESREKELANISTEATWKDFQQGPKRIRVPGSRFAQLFENVLLTERKEGKDEISKRSRPPPGLDFSGFGPPAPWISSASHTGVYYERVLEAEDWFHQGNNLKDDLPPEFGQRLSHELDKVLNVNNEEARAVQACDVFKRVMGNLYSYSRTYKSGKRTCKSLGFADLGPVGDSCCEPRYGGRRSFFDNDPCARQWRLQTTRFASDFMLSMQRQSTLTQNHGSSSLSLS